MLRRISGLALCLALAIAGGGSACSPATPDYAPRDRTLARLPLFFYPVARNSPRAVLVFFGNDIGFWKAHDQLARLLSNHGYDVIGVDIKKYIERLPHGIAAREQAFATSIGPMIARAVAELHADSLPLVIGGHSYGADMALWTAVHVPPPHLVGVLALGPTARSHFYVTMRDIANIEPDVGEPGSFTIADQLHDLSPVLRVALIRGAHDPRRPIDSVLTAAGGSRVRYTVVPFAGHSLKSLTIAGPMTDRALDWIVTGR